MINFIDGLHLGRAQVIGCGLVGTDQLALIDSGPECCFDATVAAIRRLGLRPENVTHLLVTHIHLDHSGGAWRWARDFGTTVCVHPRGAPHLQNPEKLVASATMIFGDKMPVLWGEVRAVPPEKIRIVHDGDEIVAGGTVFRAVETPGHAPHHHAYWLARERTLFAGDVGGVSINGGPLLPPCPPPDINLELWRASLEKIHALQPARLWLTHFGAVETPDEHLLDLGRRLTAWADWIKTQLRAGRSEAELEPRFTQLVAEELRRHGVNDELIATYEQADPAAMSVGGLARYWRKFHPAELA
ncbi:MAG: MBL fold metallo-hydrolase [Opitutae bacterium]|nr:MBL fold metallo-hydrolase [Opitutae bacterium]